MFKENSQEPPNASGSATTRKWRITSVTCSWNPQKSLCTATSKPVPQSEHIFALFVIRNAEKHNLFWRIAYSRKEL